ncbi:hypothetical protein [Streptomyces sp. NPDC087512]|uniref:hypothetical protein n=1 Tax=unclassified Streptomyces TaxID=2593676 RepID=UPI00343AA81E
MHTMTAPTAPTAAAPTHSDDATLAFGTAAPYVSEAGGDFLLQPPRPAERVPCRVDPVDLRRLDLLALLTAAGIAPCPGDRDAIDQLSKLPGSVHAALHRWLEQSCGPVR